MFELVIVGALKELETAYWWPTFYHVVRDAHVKIGGWSPVTNSARALEAGAHRARCPHTSSCPPCTRASWGRTGTSMRTLVTLARAETVWMRMRRGASPGLGTRPPHTRLQQEKLIIV